MVLIAVLDVAFAVFTPFSVALTVPLAVVLTVFSAFLAVVFIVRFPCCLVFISEFAAVWDVSVLAGAAETAGRLAVPCISCKPQKAAQTAKATAKATAEATKGTVKATIAAVKAIIAGTKALISALIAGGWIAVVIILIVVLLGCAVSLFGGGSDSTSYTPVSAEVEAYTPLIQKYAKQYGIPEYVELIKAVMMQESGGKGSDPMQAAEGSFNKKYPHEPNGIKDPEYSIECGVQELKAALVYPLPKL